LGLILVESVLGRYPYPDPDSGLTNLCYFDLMEYIITKPIPKLPSSCPKELVDFISICLRKEAGTRLTATELLKHPFVSSYSQLDSKFFVGWLEGVY